MWCRSCQQDVPGIAAADDPRSVCCARCGGVIAAGAPNGGEKTLVENPDFESLDNSAVRTAKATHESRPPLPVDDWEFEDQLRAAERLAKRFHARPQSAAQNPIIPTPHVRFDAPAHNTSPTAPAKRKSERPIRKPSVIAWGVLSLGLMTFVCGAVLLVWSFVASRHDLWSLGLPLTLVGQAALVIGLVLQLDSLWQSSRDTTDSLHELDEELGNLRHTTTLMGRAHGSAAQSFYAHMAEGARPELLLADLKGQLDLLAMQMSRERH